LLWQDTRTRSDLRVSIAASDLLMRWDRMSSELFTFTFHCNPSSTTLPAPQLAAQASHSIAQADQPCSCLWLLNDVMKGSNMVTHPHGQQTCERKMSCSCGNSVQNHHKHCSHHDHAKNPQGNKDPPNDAQLYAATTA